MTWWTGDPAPGAAAGGWLEVGTSSSRATGMADPNTTVEVEDTARRRAYINWQRMSSETYYIATKDEISRSPRYLRTNLRCEIQ